MDMSTRESKLLQLIEEADDFDDVLYQQMRLMNYYLKTNQLDKRAALYAEHKALIEELEELDKLAEENEKKEENKTIILENIQDYDEESAYNKGYYSKWNKDFKPKNKLEELEYKLGQLDSEIDRLEMGDNSILYNTDIYANEWKKLKAEIAKLKEGGE